MWLWVVLVLDPSSQKLWCFHFHTFPLYGLCFQIICQGAKDDVKCISIDPGRQRSCLDQGLRFNHELFWIIDPKRTDGVTAVPDGETWFCLIWGTKGRSFAYHPAKGVIQLSFGPNMHYHYGWISATYVWSFLIGPWTMTTGLLQSNCLCWWQTNW